MTPETLPLSEPTLEERIAPCAAMIEQVKAKTMMGKWRGSDARDFLKFQPAQNVEVVDFNEILELKTKEEYAELIATMALFEEYELLNHLFCSKKFSEKAPSEKAFSIADLLNTRVRPAFSAWQPTPLYSITSKKARKMMGDPCKMVRFLHEYGADPNLAAGDGSTPLWNQTNIDCPVEILQTLLEIGADPNQISRDSESEWAPLAYCLLPSLAEDETDTNNWRPFDKSAIEKATLLLAYGADPNLACPCMPELPPLELAFTYGVAQGETWLDFELRDLIELLLKSGADPNFTDSNGNTLLSIAAGRELKRVVELLLEYGAKLPAGLS